MLKIVKNEKGVYLINMAILLPIFLLFWGWIISRALLLDREIGQQIAVDMAAISGVHHGSKMRDYPPPIKDLYNAMAARSVMVLETYGLTADVTPTADFVSQDHGQGGGVGHEGHGHENDGFEVSIISTAPVFDLLFISNVTITKHASAAMKGFHKDCFKKNKICPEFTATTRLLP